MHQRASFEIVRLDKSNQDLTCVGGWCWALDAGKMVEGAGAGFWARGGNTFAVILHHLRSDGRKSESKSLRDTMAHIAFAVILHILILHPFRKVEVFY